jgi:hypothetical protein
MIVPMTEVLTPRQRNRSMLARQLLLERSSLSIPEALEQVGGLQTQYAPSGYVGLWTRLADFERVSLTRSLEQRDVVQATLMRNTIHLVPATSFWRYAVGVRRARREGWPVIPGAAKVTDTQEGAELLRAELMDGPKTVKELGDLASGFLGRIGLWVDLVRVPPSATWERRRADRLALADQWVGPEDATERDAIAYLVRAYLRGFGPAPWKAISAWSMVTITALKQASAEMELVRYRDESGRELIDLPDAPLPDADMPAPVRFLPHWDALLLAHARHGGVLPEPYRPLVFSPRNPFSVGTVVVDGRVVASWSFKDNGIRVEPFEELSATDADEVERERARLEAFHL